MLLQSKQALLPKKWNENRSFRDIVDGVIFLFSLLVVAFRFEVVGCLVLLGVIGVLLVLSDRLSDVFLPLILMTVFVTRCYDSFDTFIKFIPLYVVLILCVLFHFIYYRAKPTGIGTSFRGLVAVSAALLLGGIGSLSAAAYFRPMNLYYVLGLGVAMPLLYLALQPRADEEARDRFLRGLFLSGCLAAYAVLVYYVRGWGEFRESYHALYFQSKNNLATFLMISLPVGFYFSKQKPALIVAPVLQYVALFFCDSRGGTFLGTLEFFFLLVFFCFYRSDKFRRAFFLAILLLTLVLVLCLLPKVVRFIGFDQKIDDFSNLSIPQLLKQMVLKNVDSGEIRVGLFQRSIDDFRSNPVFGVGIGHTGNEDLYPPVKGAMNWYHLWLPQIWGSLGIIGLLCFGYQLFLRLKLAFTRREFPEVTLSLCYGGLLLMSQVNPGEFCPVPYALIAMVIFLFLDQKEPSGKKTEKTEN